MRMAGPRLPLRLAKNILHYPHLLRLRHFAVCESFLIAVGHNLVPSICAAAVGSCYATPGWTPIKVMRAFNQLFSSIASDPVSNSVEH